MERTPVSMLSEMRRNLLNRQFPGLALLLSYLLVMSGVEAGPGLPYEQMPGQMQIEQADNNRVPQVEFQTEPMMGATLLKETDYRGEGPFPLTFTRYNASPQSIYAEGCDYYAALGNNWTHNYASCLIDHLNYGGPASNRTIAVCTMGICTTFEETLTPRSADVRDTLVRNGSINGTIYSWVYTQFKTGIREAYGADYRLVARFDRSGIEHRLTFQTTTSWNHITTTVVKTVTHVPSGRSLVFQYVTGTSGQILLSMTDPAGAVYAYNLNANPGTVSYPAAKPSAAGLTRSYTSDYEYDCQINGGLPNAA